MGGHPRLLNTGDRDPAPGPHAFIAGPSSRAPSLQPQTLSSLTVPSWGVTEHRTPAKPKVPPAGAAQDLWGSLDPIGNPLGVLEGLLKPPPQKAKLEQLRLRANNSKGKEGGRAGHGHHTVPGQPGSTRVWQLHPQPTSSLASQGPQSALGIRSWVSGHQTLSSLWTSTSSLSLEQPS